MMTSLPLFLPELDDALLRQRFNSSSPFRHVVLDDAFDPDVLNAILTEYPGPEDINWIRFDNPNEVKLASQDPSQLGENTLAFIQALNSPRFLASLEALSDIPNLVADPTLWGGGLHQIEPSGRLEIHADFNIHEHLGLYRRLNLILYVNKDWPADYGGHLEMWDAGMRCCEQRILPVFNRCVIFEASETSYHGHPEPLACPPDRTRKSIALYYYTETHPDRSQDPVAHSTLFPQRQNA